MKEVKRRVDRLNLWCLGQIIHSIQNQQIIIPNVYTKQTLSPLAPKSLISPRNLCRFLSYNWQCHYKKGRISIHTRMSGYIKISNIILSMFQYKCCWLLRHLFCNLLNTMLVVGGTSAGLVHSHNVTFSNYLHVIGVISFFWFQ